MTVRVVSERCIVWAAALSLIACLTGCENISMKRFAPATRIDARLNPGIGEYPPLFESQMKRVRDRHRLSCEDTATIRAVCERIAVHEEQWENWWAYPPPPPPVVLEFYHGKQWLGSLDLYDWALGHEHNKIHRLEPEEAADILRLLCDCAIGTPTRTPEGNQTEYSRP